MPFRQPQRIARLKLFTWATVAGGVAIALSLVGSLTEIGSRRFSSAELATIDPPNSTTKNCDWQIPFGNFPKVEFCRIGTTGSVNPMVLWGNFHAESMLAAADDNFRKKGISGVVVRNGYCRPIVGTYEKSKLSLNSVSLCERSQAALLDYLRQSHVRAIVIAIRWTFQLYPIDGIIDELGFDNGEGGKETKSYREYVVPSASGGFARDADAKYRVMRDFINSMAALDTPVMVIYPVPEVGWHVPNLNLKHLISTGQTPSVLSTSSKRYFERNAFVIASLDSIIAQTNVIGFKPSDILCNTYVPDRCVAQINGTPLYFDDNHLNNAGEDLLMKEILKKLE